MTTIAKKIMWIGRATVFAVGLAVTLALILGVATAALAAVPGDPLKLGQVNSINALTALVGNRAGAMLFVDNNSKAAGARALDLRVEQGRAPMTVNADAGKAANLNADRLDGKDQSAFFSGKTYAKIDRRQGPGGGELVNRQVNCDDGDRVVGGGFEHFGDEDVVEDSFPLHEDINGVEGWVANVLDNGPPDTIEARVVCADFPPLR